jgi:hypothetical protein
VLVEAQQDRAKVAVAADGKSMTVTTTGTDPKGQAVNNVAHYTRQ